METQTIKVSPLLLLMDETYGYLYDGNVFRHRVTGATVSILWNDDGTIAKGFVHPYGEEVHFVMPVNNRRENWVDKTA